MKGVSHLTVKGPKDVEISGISSNSQAISPGHLFIAKKGLTHHGSRFIPQAIEGGAVAILTDLFDPTFKGITQLIHPDVAAIEGKIAANFCGNPSEILTMIGITGTNGKTTTAFLIQAFLKHCGMIGTIEYVIGNKRTPAVRTTPDVVTNQTLLAEMVANNCESCVMEVSSHALKQQRVDEIFFDIAIFTNLTQDHLDYHKTMEEYAKAKKKLFTSLGHGKKRDIPKRAVVNIDSPHHLEMVSDCPVPVFTYGIDTSCDLKASELQFTPSKTSALITFLGKSVRCEWPLIGRFNTYNMLGAMAVPLILGVPLEALAPHLKNAPAIPGRLEVVPNDLGLNILVDFAHSDDAFKNVFESLQELKKGRLITVFGCGGDRDRLKRPKMAQVCEAYSDLSIVTNDNPRGESPHAIINEVIAGFKKRDSYYVEPDRALAIRYALTEACPDDIVLIAGKGHETSQVFAHQTVEFDDRKVAGSICGTLKN